MTTLISCEDDRLNVGSLNGRYEGIFFRTAPAANHQTSDVTLVFKGDTFEGSGNITKYPAICHGTYTLTGDVIEFNNLCVWTAEFDWSYILSGKFIISREGNEIIMIRTYSGGVYDTYKLSSTPNVP